jgi:AraC family transcriptional activator of pobA
MQKVENAIPVYDICSLSAADQVPGILIGEPFAAYLKAHPNLHLPHRHSFYHIVFFTEGDGYHTIDFEKFGVEAGQIYFMIPGQVHSWNFKSKADGFVINFSPDLFESFLRNDLYLERFNFLRGVAKESVCHLAGDVYKQSKGMLERIVFKAKNMDAHALDFIRCSCLLPYSAPAKTMKPCRRRNTIN